MAVEQSKKKGRRRRAALPGEDMNQSNFCEAEPFVVPESEAGMSPNLQAHIGRHLRAAFDEVAREPIPDRLLQLLKDLDRSGGK
jgi:hypothetical protein